MSSRPRWPQPCYIHDVNDVAALMRMVDNGDIPLLVERPRPDNKTLSSGDLFVIKPRPGLDRYTNGAHNWGPSTQYGAMGIYREHILSHRSERDGKIRRTTMPAVPADWQDQIFSQALVGCRDDNRDPKLVPGGLCRKTVKVVLREITYRIVSIYSPYDAHMGLLPRVSEVFPDPAHILRDELFGLRVVNRVEVQELLINIRTPEPRPGARNKPRVGKSSQHQAGSSSVGRSTGLRRTKRSSRRERASPPTSPPASLLALSSASSSVGSSCSALTPSTPQDVAAVCLNPVPSGSFANPYVVEDSQGTYTYSLDRCFVAGPAESRVDVCDDAGVQPQFPAAAAMFPEPGTFCEDMPSDGTMFWASSSVSRDYSTGSFTAAEPAIISGLVATPQSAAPLLSGGASQHGDMMQLQLSSQRQLYAHRDYDRSWENAPITISTPIVDTMTHNADQFYTYSPAAGILSEPEAFNERRLWHLDKSSGFTDGWSGGGFIAAESPTFVATEPTCNPPTCMFSPTALFDPSSGHYYSVPASYLPMSPSISSRYGPRPPVSSP